MVILPEEGLIAGGKYVIREMKIHKSIVEAVATAPLQSIWSHLPGQEWDRLGDNIILGRLLEKDFYVTKVRIVEWFVRKT
jgi:hypothetical protein